MATGDDPDEALDDFNGTMRELDEQLDAMERALEGKGPAPDANSPEAQAWRAQMLKDIAEFEAKANRFFKNLEQPRSN